MLWISGPNSHSDVLYKTPPEFFVVYLWIAFHSSTSVWNYLYLLTERSGHTPKHRNHARRMRPHEAYSSSSQQIAGCGQSSSPHSPLHNLLEHLGRHEIPPKHTLCLRADSWFQLCHYHNTFSATASEFPWVQLSHENLCSQTLNPTTSPGVSYGWRHRQRHVTLLLSLVRDV